MRTLVLDPSVAGIDELLERRRRLGQDRHDEVWDGVLHVSPYASGRHADIQIQVATIMRPLAMKVGLWATADFNFGAGPQSFRVPDGGLHRERPLDLYMPTAVLVLEVVSPHDESWEKLPFYAASGVDEVLIVDPRQRTVDWLGLTDGAYEPITHSNLIALGPAELASQLDWPPIS